MAACVPVLDLPVGYKRKFIVDQDAPEFPHNKVQRVEHEFCFMSEVTHMESTRLDQQELVQDSSSLTHAASYPEFSDIQFAQDHNQLHLADTLMDFSSLDETSINQDSSAAPLPSSVEDFVVNASAPDLVQPHIPKNPTKLIDNSIINLDDEDDHDGVCIVINLDDEEDDDDDEEASSVLQQSLTTVQTVQSTKEVKDSSLKGNNDVQPSPTTMDSSFMDSSIHDQMQHADNDQERTCDNIHDSHDSHTVGISDDLDFMKLVEFEKLDFYQDEFSHSLGKSDALDFMKFIDFEKLEYYEDEFDSIRFGIDALESGGTDSLADAHLQQPGVEVKESNGIEVVIID